MRKDEKTQEEIGYFLKIEHFPQSSLEAKYLLNLTLIFSSELRLSDTFSSEILHIPDFKS